MDDEVRLIYGGKGELQRMPEITDYAAKKYIRIRSSQVQSNETSQYISNYAHPWWTNTRRKRYLNIPECDNEEQDQPSCTQLGTG